MSSRTIKKLLLSLIVIGILGSFTVGGTFAVLNSQANNPNESIATGKILMTNAVGAVSPCYSTTNAANKNINPTCTQLFSTGQLFPLTTTTPPAYPSATVGYANVTITSAAQDVSNSPVNSTLPATLSVYMPNCDATDNATVGSVHGGTNPCCPGDSFVAGTLPASANPCPTGSLSFFIQEYTSSSFGTALSSCVFPYSATTACTFQADTLGNFFGLYHDNTDYFSLGAISAGGARYFRIGMAEPVGAANGLQGETATFSLYWHMQ